MKKIIAVINIFDKVQNIYVYKDGSQVSAVQCSINNLQETVYSLANSLELESVDVVGPTNYAKGILEAPNSKFSKTITYNYI